MQNNEEERLFLSKDLEDIIDLDNLSSTNISDNNLWIKLFDEKFSILSYVNSKNKYKVTFKINKKSLQKLFINKEINISIGLEDFEESIFNGNKSLLKYKLYNVFENNYKIKIIIYK